VYFRRELNKIKTSVSDGMIWPICLHVWHQTRYQTAGYCQLPTETKPCFCQWKPSLTTILLAWLTWLLVGQGFLLVKDFYFDLTPTAKPQMVKVSQQGTAVG